MVELIERIEAILKKKGLTFNRVEHDCGLGNGTIKRWREQSPRLDKLVTVSEYLDVSLDFLVFGTLQTDSSLSGESSIDIDRLKQVQGLLCDGSPLDEDEADLIAMRRLLPPEHQRELFELTYFKYKRIVEEGKESIYSTYLEDGSIKRSGPGGIDDDSTETA